MMFISLLVSSLCKPRSPGPVLQAAMLPESVVTGHVSIALSLLLVVHRHHCISASNLLYASGCPVMRRRAVRTSSILENPFPPSNTDGNPQLEEWMMRGSLSVTEDYGGASTQSCLYFYRASLEGMALQDSRDTQGPR